MSQVYQKVEDEILNKHFLNEFRTGYIKIDNFLLPEYFKEFSDSVESFEVKNTDIWVCSFPKTGKIFIGILMIFVQNKYSKF